MIKIMLRGAVAAGLAVLAVGLLLPVRVYALTDEEREQVERISKEEAQKLLDEAVPELEGKVTIKGTGQFGYVLRAETEIKSKHGELEYSWYRYDEDEKKTKKVGSGKTYTVKDKDVGCIISVTVTAQGTRGELSDSLDEEHNGGRHIHRAEIPEPSAPFVMDYEPVVADDGTVTYTVIIPEAEGCEYSFDGENWSKTSIMAGFAPGTEVTAYRRYETTDYVKGGEATSSTLALPVITAETAMMANPGEATPEQQAAAKAAAKADQQAKADQANDKTEAAAAGIEAANKAKNEAAAAAAAAEEARLAAEEAEKRAERAAQREAEAAAKAQEQETEKEEDRLAAMVTKGTPALAGDEQIPADAETADRIESQIKQTEHSRILVVILVVVCGILAVGGFELLITARNHTPFPKLFGKKPEEE